MADPSMPVTLPTPTATPREASREALESGYLVVCWNDPVNLMPYVTHVFQQVFG